MDNYEQMREDLKESMKWKYKIDPTHILSYKEFEKEVMPLMFYGAVQEPQELVLRYQAYEEYVLFVAYNIERANKLLNEKTRKEGWIRVDNEACMDGD